ncbi:MAG: 23S rRNA (pseudouridine(1915)-N(3))-methyltransferase RlmH [Patescibacteria group bacterium]
MKLRILAVGRLKEDYLRAAAADYTARIKPYAQIEVVEVAGLRDPARLSSAAIERVKDEEAAALLGRVLPGEILVALDQEGRKLDSEGFARFLKGHEESGSRLALAVGGSWGFGRAVLERASLSLSLSPMTFPHGLARVILLEQIYRAFRIIRGEKYHK